MFIKVIFLFAVMALQPPAQADTAPDAATLLEKADAYRTSYQKAVLDAPGLSLGSYAFIWGFKMEATGTWYCYGVSRDEPWDCGQQPDNSKITAVAGQPPARPGRCCPRGRPV